MRDPFVWMRLALDGTAFAIVAGTGVVVWARKRSARYWPLTRGKVEYASTREYNGTWWTEVSYSYQVADEFYSGRLQLKSRNERKADALAVRWKDQNIAIRYSPRNAEISVVRDEDQAVLHPMEFAGH